MCGIVGVVSAQADHRDPALVTRMANAIAHRGPDDSGIYASGPATLGFRRLSIIDLACGSQPMVSQDARFALVFNGEIYNFQALRTELKQSHQRHFLTRSDTEVVLQAFEVWGIKCFSRFNGMFAIAIWDNYQQRLILARDRAGKKPLFTYATSSALLFASEVKALRVHPLFSAQPDLSRIATSVAYRYVPGNETLFHNVHAFPAGHWASVDIDAGFPISSTPFWTIPACSATSGGATPLRPDHAVKRFREKLTASVRRRMVADVPVGAFLSGGIDSSLIVALMAGEGVKRLNTFSVGFDTGFSEHNYARVVAEKFATTHHETIVSASDLLKEIPAVLWYRETPISEPSDIPLYMLSREARRHVTVVLSGEGSDELFGGYPKYQAKHYLARFPSLLRSLVPAIGKLLPGVRGASSPAALAMASLSEKDNLESMARWFGAFGSQDRHKLFRPPLSDSHDDIHSFARDVDQNCPGLTRLTMMQLQDFSHWLPANLLLRSDRVTMAHSLELRCPFLDPDLIDFAFGALPDNMKIRNGQAKWLVRKMANDLLPKQITNRKKWGFKVPVSEWFRGPLKPALTEILLSTQATRRNYFHTSEIRRLINEHTQGGANHSKQLWYLFQLELWHLMFIDQTLKPGDDLPGVKG